MSENVVGLPTEPAHQRQAFGTARNRRFDCNFTICPIFVCRMLFPRNMIKAFPRGVGRRVKVTDPQFGRHCQRLGMQNTAIRRDHA